MSGIHALSNAEISLIEAMLRISPPLTRQQILSYFTRPGRDINHRIISEIRDGRWSSTLMAREEDARAFMLVSQARPATRAEDFIASGRGAARAHRWLGQLHLDWWPVGQGLFSSGTIERLSAPPLAWVYDCGTTSDDTIIQKALDLFQSRSSSRGVTSIRLAVLSHFDGDHISGFARLLAQFPVKTLLLPYIPRWRRLAIALSEGLSFEDDLFGFYLNPTAYLVEASGGRIEQIVYVRGTGSDDAPPDPPFDLPTPEGGEDGRDPLDAGGDGLKVETGEAPDDADGDPSVRPSGAVQVKFLRPSGRLIMPMFWEFLPYNDASLAARMTPVHIGRVETLINALLTASAADRDALLEKLKSLYDSLFTSSDHRNRISLFLYSGPLSRRLGLFHASGEPWNGWRQLERFSQMLTGDGYLNNRNRCDPFERHFAPGDRLARSAFLQVMHHGARRNWRAGTAAWLNPGVSIFSSEPGRSPYHPHEEVLRDFWPHGAVQVDGSSGYHFSGVLLEM